MPRGMFTQCFAVLLKEAVTLDEVVAALPDFIIQGKFEAGDHWANRGPALALPFRPDVNGVALVDVVDHAWPDDMGNPQSAEAVFTAWTMGYFGPITYPLGLQRAMQQSWGWKDGRTAPEGHHAFIRVRTTYAIGGGPEAPMMPNDWDAAAEMEYLTRIVDALLALPQAVCYFNPNGEILRDRATLRAQVAQAKSEGVIPLDAWVNVRLYPYETDWVLMDTVGVGQLNKVDAEAVNDLPDVEALFRSKQYDYAEVDHFLRDLALYLHSEGEVIKEGDTVEGPGKVSWRASWPEKPMAMPLRRAIRMVPVDGSELPAKSK